MPVEVRLHHADAIQLAVVRRTAQPSELPTLVPRACGIVWEFVRRNRLEAGRHVALYLNSNIDLEVGVELPGAFDEQGEIVRSNTPAGTVASAIHFGPYQALGVTHAAIHAWCVANGYQLTGPSWEIYGHWRPEWDDTPSAIRTDVFYLVAAESSAA
jgi:effector-binding domain-containing protein